jgi:dTDP-glucose pyrophosphorylase
LPFDHNWTDTCLTGEATITEAIRVIEASDSKVCLVVAESNNSFELRGTITDGDIRRAILSGVNITDDCAQIMNDSPFKACAESSIPDLEGLLVKHQYRHLPIVSNEGFLAGIYYSELNLVANVGKSLFVIMAGGFGSRLKPYTDRIPKPMVEVKGKPMLHHIIERAKSAGFSHFALILHHLPEVIKGYFGDGSDFGVSIEYVEEKSPLGTVGGLSLLDLAGSNYSSILVTNGDLVSQADYRDLVQYHIKQSAFATMSVRQHRMVNEFGTVNISGNVIIGFSEKPVTVSNINAGIYVLSIEALKTLEYGKRKDMPDLFLDAINLGHKVLAHYLYEEWNDVGREADLNRVNEK